MRHDRVLPDRHPRLICLVGTDGSGKTTLARALIEELRAQGYDARYVHGVLPFNRFFRPLRELVRARFMRGANVNADYEHYHATMVSASRRHRLLSGLYGVAWFVSYCLEAFRPVTLQTLRGRTVVADRYVYDIILRIAIGIDQPVGRLSRLAGIFFLLNARPDVVFLIDTPEEVALHRKGDVHSLEYLRERRVGYQELARRYGFRVLDGREAPDQLLATVLSHCQGAAPTPALS